MPAMNSLPIEALVDVGHVGRVQSVCGGEHVAGIGLGKPVERDAVDRRGVAAERDDFLACLHFPELDRLIVARRGDPPAVGSERDAPDLRGVVAER